MKRKEYAFPKITIKAFSAEEVITASSVVTKDPDAPVELPFVPANPNL